MSDHTVPAVPPPNDAALEQAVLAAMLNYPAGLLLGLQQLKGIDEIFYQPTHRALFRAMARLHAAGQPVEPFLLIRQLAEHGARVPEADVWALTNKASHTRHLSAHCQALVGLFVRRRMHRLGLQLAAQAFDQTQDTPDLLAQGQLLLHELHGALHTRRPQFISELYELTMDEIRRDAGRPGGITGVPTGLQALDKETGGWQDSDLVIIAARPGMGKTSFALACALGAARQGYAGAFFSLEMKNTQLMKKIISNETSVSTAFLTRGNLSGGVAEADYLRQKAAGLKALPLLLIDTPGLSLGEFRAQAAQLKAEHGIRFLIVDYLQLMTAPEVKGNREQEISTISRGLKLTAKELDIPVLALAQLSRETERRGGDKKPLLSDLRESGAIEQDADLVLFPHRPEYYGVKEDAMGNPMVDMSELILAKHRNGGTCTGDEAILVHSKMRYTQYTDVDKFADDVALTYRDLPAHGLRTAGPSGFSVNPDADPLF